MASFGFLYMSLFGMAADTAPPQDATPMTVQQKWQELFDWSKSEKRGVTVVVGGQQIPGVILEVGADYIEMRSQQYGAIVVKLDEIKAVMGK